MRPATRWPVVLAAAFVVACGGSHAGSGPGSFSDVPPPAGGVARFTVAPIDLSISGSVTALGHIAGGGHVEPTSHAYLYGFDLHQGAPPSTPIQDVVMPATGAVVAWYGPGGPGDYKLMFRATETFYFTLEHVMLSAPPAIGAVLHAGDPLGQTRSDSALDVGAWDADVVLTGFANPARHGPESLHCVTPWNYFVEPIRTQLYAKIYRAPSASLDQRIDQDVPGTLAGTWFDDSLPVDASIDDGPTAWPLTISFAVDEYDGATPRLSLGGWAATVSNAGFPYGGVWAVPSSIASWSAITPASGLQIVPLYDISGTVQQGLLLVQMLDAARIRLEIWAGAPSATAFDAGARTYLR